PRFRASCGQLVSCTVLADGSCVPEALRCTSRRNPMSTDPTIIYTLTDEAPLLSTCAFLPIVRAFTEPAGVRVEESDISVAARILGDFPEYLAPEQRVPDALTELGKKTLEPDT